MKQTDPYVPVTQSTAQTDALDDLRTEFKALDARIRLVSPGCRAQSLALTALEEASMWATKAVMQRDD